MIALLPGNVVNAHTTSTKRKLQASLTQPPVTTTATTAIDPKFIDPTTPLEFQTITRCTAPTPTGSPISPCDSTAPPLTSMKLVFSDEFNTPGRDLSIAANDSKWFAEDFWCSGTQDMEIYTASQAIINNGTLSLTIDKAPPGLSVPTVAGFLEDPTNPKGKPPPLYGMWNQKTTTKISPNDTAFKSGMVTSWNKFCFTGGYIEAGIKLPGDAATPGFWPAFWMMGNLARACYKWSSDGLWPFSYNKCGGEWWALKDTGAKPQSITACPDGPGVDRTRWGFAPGEGRSSPEIDMIEFK